MTNMLPTAPSLLAAAMVATSFAPAAAQDAPGDRVNQLIVYGDDACPQSTGDEIVVCARKDESERYRIPETLRGDPNAASAQAWSERVRAYEYVGKTGTQSCSPVGLGGFTGCTDKLLTQAYAERGQDDSVNWGQLIEAEREKRLSSIDADAEAVEARLREIEATVEAREAAAAEARERLRARDAAVAAGEPAPSADARLNDPLARPPVIDDAPLDRDDDTDEETFGDDS